MPIAEGHATTARAERYLTQLCDHLTHLTQVTREGDRARIEFDWGSCSLEARADELVLELHAEDPAALTRARELFTSRIEGIGRRDGLSVTWL